MRTLLLAVPPCPFHFYTSPRRLNRRSSHLSIRHRTYTLDSFLASSTSHTINKHEVSIAQQQRSLAEETAIRRREMEEEIQVDEGRKMNLESDDRQVSDWAVPSIHIHRRDRRYTSAFTPSTRRFVPLSRPIIIALGPLFPSSFPCRFSLLSSCISLHILPSPLPPLSPADLASVLALLFLCSEWP